MASIAIILGEFHKDCVNQMLAQARVTASDNNLEIVDEIWVPGSYEVPIVLQKVLAKSEVDAAVLLGIIEKGETSHGFVMAQIVMSKVLDLELTSKKPIGIGIIGPDVEPLQIAPRLIGHSRAAVEAVAKLLKIL